MRSLFLIIICPGVAMIAGGCADTEAEKPNIIFILADDLGYGDTGPYGQTKTETPNIDRLAESGMRFTRHYSGSPVCAPSRCVLLTGMHTGHSQVRENDEWAERGDVWSYSAMLADSTLEGQRPLATGTTTIATILRQNGYVTGAIGKWGLGAPHTEGIPTRQGFDFFYGYNCQRQAHTYYPLFLYRNENRVWLDNDTLAPHSGFSPGSDPSNPANYDRFRLSVYAPDMMFNEMISFIDANSDRPFFLYWATTIPHLSLQPPQELMDYYVAKFGDEKPYTGDEGYFPARYPHASYAAMISYLDDQIGKLIKHLREQGIYEKTLIIFTSDNGPACKAGTDPQWFGSAAPFRGDQGYGKGYLYEGGIRVPMIASWPGVIKEGSVSDHISAFWDIMPTLCEITDAEMPVESDGISFLPALKGKKQTAHRYLYWEYPGNGGQQAVMIGNMKAIRRNMHKENTEFELYDLGSDPTETINIAADHPDIIEQVKKIIQKEHVRSPNLKWRFKVLNE